MTSSRVPPGADLTTDNSRDDAANEATALLGQSVARLRRSSNQTLTAVAAQAGLSPAYMSQMESGAANPTVRTLAHIAAALGVAPADLLRGDAAAPPAGAPFPPRFCPAPLLAAQADYRGIWDLTADGAVQLSLRLLRADCGDHAEAVRHDGEEVALVLAGQCRIRVGTTVHTLRTGDSCHYSAADAHQITDPSDDLLMLIVLTSQE
ncbi:helix-turn-helix domain-containing protein [Peterkaempfera sp. SMS 1(5)a]|uniref:helix-turn-helix domain-containing protein n=1 Tax=Peterkaempfera podocarpi TaxID=3232308 RepID=UPI003671D670